METSIILSIVVGSAIFTMLSVVVIIIIRQRRRPAPQRSENYISIDSSVDPHVSSCYTAEYVQHPHRQPLQRASTIPFELPLPPQTMTSAASNTSINSSVPDGDQQTPNNAFCLGSIDPKLYDLSDDEDTHYDFPQFHIGRLWFSVEYKVDCERLVITVLRAKNLQSRSMSSPTMCDSYVRIQLLPEERRFLQTKVKKRTCNPKYEESFVFQVSCKCIEERAFKLTVFSINKHRKHHMIGHVVLSLRDVHLENDEKVTLWRDLERDGEPIAEKGELLVSTCYNSQLERITVGVYQAKDLHGEQNLSDFNCKVSLLQQSRVVKTKRTDVIKKCTSPAFNESFTFKLSSQQLDCSSINIVVAQHFLGHKDKPVGRITLGPFMFARGKELSHWNEMVANQKEQISYWHKLS